MVVNAILTSQRDGVQGNKIMQRSLQGSCLPAHSGAEDMFYACAGVKFQWSHKGQVLGPV